MSSITSLTESMSAPRLLELVRARIHFKHYSIRTEQTYVDWIKRFIRHYGKRHPKNMGAVEVQVFFKTGNKPKLSCRCPESPTHRHSCGIMPGEAHEHCLPEPEYLKSPVLTTSHLGSASVYRFVVWLDLSNTHSAPWPPSQGGAWQKASTSLRRMSQLFTS